MNLGDPDRGRTYFGIEVTRRCNLRCPHCFTSSGGPVAEGASTEQLLTLIERLATAGIRSLAFTGGEPLLRRDLAKLIEHSRRAGIGFVGLVTNGCLVDARRASELLDAGLSGVQVSVDGVDAKDHSRVRDSELSDFYRALRAIRLFLDRGITVDVATILSPRNLVRAPEMAMFCEALGVRGLRYCTFVPTGRGAQQEVTKSYQLEAAAVDRFLEFVRHMNRQKNARLALFIDHAMGPWQESFEFACVAGKEVAYLSAEGDLYPCPSLIHEPFRVGNAFETPIAELLASSRMATVRAIGRSELSGPCASCANHACAGGCRGAAFARSGTDRASAEYCSYRGLRKSLLPSG